MSTCPLCPNDTDLQPEMLPEHIALIHPDTITTPLRVTPIDGITQEQIGGLLAEVAPQIAATFLDKIATTEHQAEHAYAAGWKDSWTAALNTLSKAMRHACEQAEKHIPGDALLPGMWEAAAILNTLTTDPDAIPGPNVLTPHDLLTVLNDGTPPVYCDYQFAVAVSTYATPEEASTAGLHTPWAPFRPGEIVVVDADGSEPFSPYRHTGKWYVQFETFASLTEAQTRAAQITDAA